MLRMPCQPQQRSLLQFGVRHCQRRVFFLQVVRVHETVATVADLLLTSTHGGYPVVQQIDNGNEVFTGLISRCV